MPPHKRVLLLPMLSVLAHHIARDCRHGNSWSEGHHQREWEWRSFYWQLGTCSHDIWCSCRVEPYCQCGGMLMVD